jgi:hypothetical protein
VSRRSLGVGGPARTFRGIVGQLRLGTPFFCFRPQRRTGQRSTENELISFAVSRKNQDATPQNE